MTDQLFPEADAPKVAKPTQQNRSTAVMQRRVESKESLDDFPTPPWATRAICAELISLGLGQTMRTVREPCANRGYMVRPLAEHFDSVDASDIYDYGFGYRVEDYLFGSDQPQVDWTFFNPPFRLAQQFIERGLRTSRVGVACIVRSAFTEGVARYNELYSKCPPSFEFQHVERVPMVKGRYDPKASTATAYTWLLWLIADGNNADSRKRWIAPCRKLFERDSDCETAVCRVTAA
jgi:hypothetical protein